MMKMMRIMTVSANNNGGKLAAFVVAVALSMWTIHGAAAKEVSISGMWSVNDIKTDCDAVGGSFYHDTSYGTYGCTNNKKDTYVDCYMGKCTGGVPGRKVPPRTLSGILHLPSAGLKAAGGARSQRHSGHPAVTGDFKTKANYRHRSTGPTNPNGPGPGTGPFAPPTPRTHNGGNKTKSMLRSASEHRFSSQHSGSGKH
jgi:hypothetical protein